MKIFRIFTWAVLACGWTAAFFTLLSLVGSTRWLAHTGHVFPAALNLLMASLCAIAAVWSVRRDYLPAPMMWCVAAGAGLHLLNLFSNSIGQAGPLLVLAHVLPTNSYVIQRGILPPSLAFAAKAIKIGLPVASLIAALTWKFRSEKL